MRDLLPLNWDELETKEHGRQAFWDDKPLSANQYDPVTAREGHAEWNHGWQYGWSQAYAMGQMTGRSATDEADCPYTQFSGAWEAWGDGFNDACEHGARLRAYARVADIIGKMGDLVDELLGLWDEHDLNSVQPDSTQGVILLSLDDWAMEFDPCAGDWRAMSTGVATAVVNDRRRELMR